MGSRSHRDGLANSLLPIAIISVSPRYAIGPTEFAWPTLCFAYYQNRSHRVCVIGQTELRFYPNPSTSVPPSWSYRSHRKPERSHFELNQSDWVSLFSLTEFGNLCVTTRFCVEAIYTPPPILHSWGEPSERAYTSSIHFLRENHLLMCWDQDIPIQPQESWSLAFPKLLSTQIIFPP